ncbi:MULTISPECIES: ABC transporter permease [Virgibacillus]|uniref:Diguanylate cyclase n=1 Tax=Virgibacillus pantothenticus TaxID=1473 RepID=A0A0L0QL82_VIRPA|nr:MULTISPECIES: ABC transporter permease [Virgibacillus]API91605.1 diguanylate cyclase [Virgibacillus sp. 6R]KNE19352.1 diguanylate cyclase [Virgibacillus pantothenticus]MBS7426873.1 ABC transporter permease [Virgibacillus sp. 19R1-5]MBU8568320.1 ABC transporter permease [Virgibacillus pantothenticus]MBU8602225.1 ABC transporter permease [Virgibacillus pantothenticus]
MSAEPANNVITKSPKTDHPFKRSLKDFYSKLRKNKSALVGGYLIIVLVLIALIGPLLTSESPDAVDYGVKLEGPSAEHWFGTDHHGRDIFTRIIHGLGITMSIGISATILGGIVGIFLGLVSGYYGGKIDTIIMRIMDVLLAFPGILLALALISILGANLQNVVIAVAIFAIPTFARIVRGSTLATKNLEYIDAMKALGASDTRIIFKHILPNILSPIIVQGSLFIATAVLSASGLSFLGMGAQPPSPELGALLSDGRDFMWDAGHIALFPGLVIMLIVLAFNIFGDGLRDALDPKMKK